MKTIARLLPLFFSVLLVLFAPAAISQGKAILQSQSQSDQSDLTFPWFGLVTVADEDRTRTLRVSGSKQVESGIFELDAIYGWTDGNQTSVRAEMIITTDQKRTIRITTQPGSKITATQGQDGTFVGTFTATNGKVKGLTIQILSEDDLAKARVRLAEGPPISLPTSDVPEVCARFIGGWVGDWGFGKRQLWITEVNPQCTAKYSYSPQTQTLKSVEIKDNALSFSCGSGGGNCSFEHHGDELWGRYTGSDGTNNAVFRKTK